MRPPSRSALARFADLALPWAVGLFLVLVVGEEDYEGAWSGALTALGVTLAVIQGAALHWRRRRPEWVMAVTVVGGLGIQLLAPETIVPVAGLFAVGSLAAARPPRVSLIGLLALEALVATTFFTAPLGDSLFTMALAVGAWALGEAARNRRVAIGEEARRAVAEEKGRIARELHDV
jgi:signal transduction histidine kinase